MNNKKDNGSAVYNNEHVFVKNGWGHKRVCIHDIVYLEAQQNYCVIHLHHSNEKSRMMVTVSMCEVLEDLNPNLFVRIHRSYAVNIEHINVIAGYMVEWTMVRTSTLAESIETTWMICSYLSAPGNE